ncbi:hypothetical protein GF312_14205 [Candidatus Poribacteria bacterium]|nr:hypothetical protein [Candidatus Poribacteria bacterium]
MKKILYPLVFLMILCVTLPLLAVDVDEDNKYVIVETKLYTVHWNKPAQMGYMQAFVGDSDESIINTGGRSFYHSSDYGGWKDWGQLQEWDILEEGGGKAVVQYVSKDAGNKEYTCVAHYYDSVPYIKHEVTVTADGGAVTSFQSGHEPMFEMNGTNEGIQVFKDPFPHGVYWTGSGFFGAIYGPDAQDARNHNTRMDLVHDSVGENLKDGDSATITYYVAFAEGDATDANALAQDVQDEPAGEAVSPVDSLATTWSQIRTRH